MHTVDSCSSSVSAFLIKLWKLVDDSARNDLISWSEAGTSFIIHDQAKFSKELLPLYFKHNNMASFIRQLNMYGFHKVTNYEKGGLKAESDEMEFHHQYFQKDQPALLESIKRKMSPVKRNLGNENRPSSPTAKELANEVKSIQKKQENTDAMLLNMKKENEVLWKEISLLRKKTKTQEQIIQKVIHFLVTMVRSNQGLSPKHKLPRLLHNSPMAKSKSPKLASKLGLLRGETSPLCISVLSDTLESPQGPVIHEVTEFENDEEELLPEPKDDLTFHDDYPIITGTSPPELDETASQVLGSKAEAQCPPVQELSSITAVLSPADQEMLVASDLSAPDEDVPAVTSKVLFESENDDTQRPVLISLNFDNGINLESEDLTLSTPVALNPEMLLSPQGCFAVENNANVDAEVSSESLMTPCAVVDDVENEAEVSIGPEDINKIVENSAEDVAGCSSLFGGSVKDVLLCPNSPEDEAANNQENGSNKLQLLAVSDPKPSTSGTFSKNVFPGHLFNTEDDLNWLQAQLRSGNLNIDSSALLGVCQRWESWSSLDSQLFGTDDTINSVLANQFATENYDPARNTESDIAGNEIVQFAPSVLEADCNLTENALFEFLSEGMLLKCNDSDMLSDATTALKADADDEIKVNFQALIDSDISDHSLPPPAKKRKCSEDKVSCVKM